jgi:hypothetical protein
LSTIATSRPRAKVKATVRAAKAKFQTRVRKKYLAISGSVSTSAKLRKPTLTCQPWARFSPLASTNRPLASSAVQVWPVWASLMQSQAAS